MGLVERMRKGDVNASARDDRWLMAIDTKKLGSMMTAMFGMLVALGLADIATTGVALYEGPPFVELNPLASMLFQQQAVGVAAALFLKFIPFVPLAYGVFAKREASAPVHARAFKFGVLIALCAADILYVGIVASNLHLLFAALP